MKGLAADDGEEDQPTLLAKKIVPKKNRTNSIQEITLSNDTQSPIKVTSGPNEVLTTEALDEVRGDADPEPIAQNIEEVE